MKSTVTFDESAWTVIEPLLPNDISAREVVLEDFMWFMGRSKKYKSNKEKVEDYIRHLQLKANPKFELQKSKSEYFRVFDIEAIRNGLNNLLY